MEIMKISNIYNLNIYPVFTFMFKIKQITVPAAFRNDFRETSHHYSAGFSNFVVVIFCQTKPNLLFHLEVKGSGTDF